MYFEATYKTITNLAQLSDERPLVVSFCGFSVEVFRCRGAGLCQRVIFNRGQPLRQMWAL